MKKINILWLLLELLFLIVFNSLFFILGDVENFTSSVWISYGFIHFAYFVLLLTPLLVRKSNVEADYRRPLYFITGTYFLIEFLVGITFILIALNTIKTTLIVQTILAALFLGWLLVHLIANEHTANSLAKRGKING
jgi:uncharacterized membrane protein